MQSEQSFAARPVGAVIKDIASDRVAPGAGSAAAIGLALAAACAGKAVAISLKHRDADPVLERAQTTLAAIAERALSGADDDAKHFREFVRNKDEQAGQALIDSGTHLQRVAQALQEVLDAIESSIDAPVSGDVVAARALCKAFSDIQTMNLAENAAEMDDDADERQS